MGYVLVALFALLLGAGVGYARAYFQAGEVGGTVTVVIKEGSSLRAIAAELETRGVVQHARAFEIEVEGKGYATRLMPGTYEFHINEPYDVLIAKLLKGTKAPTVKVSIPEGTTLKQAAGIVSDDVKASRPPTTSRRHKEDPPPFDLEGYKKGTTLEGVLFPATYDVDPKKASARKFVRAQLDAFDANFAKVDMPARPCRRTSRSTTWSSSRR